MKNNSISKLKALACYLVVFNHFNPVRGGITTYTLSHCGVPIFFLVSGYYFLDKDGNLPLSRLTKKIKHICYLLICHIILYSLYQIIIEVSGGNSIVGAFGNLLPYFSVKAFAKAIIIGTGFMGGGEWFLASLIDAYIVIGLFFQNEKIRNIINKFSALIAVLLLFTHIFLRAVIVKIGITGIGAFSFLETYSVRNTWFDAIPFMLIGMTIRNNNSIVIKHPKIDIAIAVIISIGEGYAKDYIFDLSEMGMVLYTGTIFAVVFLMIWCINNNSSENIFSYIGEKLSMLIYFLHPIVGWTMQDMVEIFVTQSSGFTQNFLFTISIMLVTTLISMGIVYVKSKIDNIVLRRNST